MAGERFDRVSLPSEVLLNVDIVSFLLTKVSVLTPVS